MRRVFSILVRLAFLAEIGTLPWLGLSLAGSAARPGGAWSEWAFYASLGGAVLFAALWVALRVDPGRLVGRVAFLILDLLSIAASGAWIFLTQGTIWLGALAWGLLVFGLSLASLAVLLGGGAGDGSGKDGQGVLRKILDERRSKARQARRSKPVFFFDLLSLILVVVLAVNSIFAWNGYGGGDIIGSLGKVELASELEMGLSAAAQADFEKAFTKDDFLGCIRVLVIGTRPASTRPASEAAPPAAVETSATGFGVLVRRILQSLLF